MAGYINIYESTRCHGGPEEGGWWYNWSEGVNCFKIFIGRKQSKRKKRQNKRHHPYLSKKMDRKVKRIEDTCGNNGEDVLVEKGYFQSQSNRRPHYE